MKSREELEQMIENASNTQNYEGDRYAFRTGAKSMLPFIEILNKQLEDLGVQYQSTLGIAVTSLKRIENLQRQNKIMRDAIDASYALLTEDSFENADFALMHLATSITQADSIAKELEAK